MTGSYEGVFRTRYNCPGGGGGEGEGVPGLVGSCAFSPFYQFGIMEWN